MISCRLAHLGRQRSCDLADEGGALHRQTDPRISPVAGFGALFDQTESGFVVSIDLAQVAELAVCSIYVLPANSKPCCLR
jgi:hypothetical protein